jgi:lactate dehydrogenase-like 2-hydroxyacid dehydrogenase
MRLSLAGFRHHPVLVAGPAFDDLLARLAPFFDVDVADDVDPTDREVLQRRLAGKSGLLDARRLPIDAALLASMPQLRAVCRIGAADEGIDLAACTRASVIVTDTPRLGDDGDARRRMALIGAENLIAAFGFGRHAGHPANMLNTELRCTMGCCF